MSERINHRLDNFDSNKAAAEQKDFEDSLYGEAGSTDFSDEARKRVGEADAYERQLENMAAREGMSEDEVYDSVTEQAGNDYMDNLHEEALSENEAFDEAKQAEAQELNDRMQADPRVRRMQMLANDIASLGASEFNADNEARKTQALKDKQDKLESLLIDFNENSLDTFEEAERDKIVSDIINATESAPQSVEASAEVTEQPSLLPNLTKEQIDTRRAAVKSVKAEMGIEDEAEYDGEAQQERMEERLEGEPLVADGLEDIVVEAEPLSADGLDPLEVPVEEGESIEDYERRTGVDTEPFDDAAGLDDIEGEEPEVRKSRRLRDRFSPTALAARLTTAKFFRGKKKEERAADTKSAQGSSVVDRLAAAKKDRERDADRERSRKDKLALGLGVVGVAAVGVGVILAAKYGLDFQPGNNGGSNGGNGGGGGGGGGGNRLNWNDFDPSARNVTNGEGWNQTFKEMGIPKGEWNDVLKSAGPKLAKLNEAYFDNNAGEWRISRPGQLSSDALRVIASSSRKNGVQL